MHFVALTSAWEAPTSYTMLQYPVHLSLQVLFPPAPACALSSLQVAPLYQEGLKEPFRLFLG